MEVYLNMTYIHLQEKDSETRNDRLPGLHHTFLMNVTRLISMRFLFGMDRT